MALLALPLVAAVALSWDRRPAADEQATVTLSLADSGESEVAYSLDITTPPAGRDDRPALQRARRRSTRSSSSPARWPASLRARFRCCTPARRSWSASTTASSAWMRRRRACRRSRSSASASWRLARRRSASLPLPRRLQAMTGSHESARIGDGGEFRDIHPFTAGDRLRRIDWKATARRGQSAADLYVRRTNALADATVLIVMDSRDDVGEQVAEWSRNARRRQGHQLTRRRPRGGELDRRRVHRRPATASASRTSPAAPG